MSGPDQLRAVVDVSAIPDRPAGAGTYVLRLVEALARRDDLDLALVARRGDVARWSVLAPGARIAGLAPTRRPARLVWEQLAGAAAGRRLGGDVWHGPHYTMPLAARPGARRLPTVVTVHDLTFFDHPEWHEPAKVRWFRAMIRASARRADVLVCVSEATATRLRELLDPSVPVVVAPHGIDADRFRPGDDAGGDEADRRLLASLGVAGRFVAFVGTVEPRKNIEGLVRAMAELPGDAALVLAGQDGWATAPVDAAIATSPRRVVRLGYVADDVVPALYRQAAVVAYPAHAEGFGLPALEALACGARVVTTAGSVMADLVEGAAALVPAGDDEALADALAAALDGGGPDPSAGPRVAAGYRWDVSAARHVEAYRLARDGEAAVR